MRSGSSSRPERLEDWRSRGKWQSVRSVFPASSCAGRPRLSLSLKLAASALALVVVSGCSQQPSRSYSGGYSSKEYFGEGKYGKASPRVVQMGENVPKGGGRYLVGRPYRIAGRTYVPSEKPAGYSVTGTASWYGAAFHGRRTANGEIYDMASITAAHPTMPLPSYARVTNLKNGKSIVVRVNDRGPYHGGRVMDMSSRVADLLEFKGAGTARVKVDYLGKAGIGGSDDRQLVATLSTGAPAQLAGYETPVEATAVAAREPEPAPTRPEPPRRAPALPPVQTRAAPEDETQIAAEPAAPTSAPTAARAFAPRPRPVAPPKPTVLDAEPEDAQVPAPNPPRAQVEPTPDEDAAPLPSSAPTPPRRPTAFNAPSPDAGQDEDAPATTTQRRAMAAQPQDDAAAPTSRRRASDGASVALYYAADATLAARFTAPGAPFSQLRDIAGDPGK
jgi:rare lipoprotein A